MISEDSNGRHVDGIFRCACHDGHFLTISYWKDDEGYPPNLEVEGYLQIEGRNLFYELWKQRIKCAWRVLRGKEAGHADVELDDPVKAREAAGVLLAFAVEYERWQARVKRKVNEKPLL